MSAEGFVVSCLFINSISDTRLLVAVKGDNTNALVMLSGLEDILQYFNDFFSLSLVCPAYPASVNLISFDRTALFICRNIRSYLKGRGVECTV